MVSRARPRRAPRSRRRISPRRCGVPTALGLYVGESGALYEAGEPLGAFTRTVPAPEPLAKVTGVGGAVLAATQEGKLLRWEAAKGWHAAPPSPALAGAHVFDLAAGGSGRVLRARLPGGPLRQRGLRPHVEGRGRALRRRAAARQHRRGRPGRAGDLRVGGGGAGPPSPAARRSSRRRRPRSPSRWAAPPTVAAVQAGRAVLDGERYYEVVRPENEGETWLLSRGALRGPARDVAAPRQRALRQPPDRRAGKGGLPRLCAPGRLRHCRRAAGAAPTPGRPGARRCA